MAHSDRLAEIEAFEPYLEAVRSSGERTRIIVYVTLLVMFFIGCGVRSFDWPAWDAARMSLMLHSYGCVTGHVNDADCSKLLEDYADQGLFFNNDAKGTNDLAIPERQRDLALKVYERRIIELMKKDLRGYAMELPLFGVAFDGNDLWLVSGALMSLLLLILTAHIERELANYEKAAANCPNEDCRNLLIMAQIFAVPGERPGHKSLIRQTVFILLYALPALLNIYVIYVDCSPRNYDFNQRMIGDVYVQIEYVLRFLTVASVGYLCFRCYRVSMELQTFITHLHHGVVGPKKAA